MTHAWSYWIQGLRLNRTVIIASIFLLIGHLALQLLNPTNSLKPSFWVVFSIISGCLMAWIIHQQICALKKSLDQSEGPSVEKNLVLTTLCTMGFTTFFFSLTPNIHSSLLMCLLPSLNAKFLGLNRLSILLLSWFSVLWIVQSTNLYWLSEQYTESFINQSLLLLPFLFVLFHYSRIVNYFARSASNRMEKLESLATTDTLTSLINRRQFNNRLFEELGRARRHHIPLSLALFDIDDFKKINDLYGHQTGDWILKDLGKLIAQNVRDSDIPARYGGEEFALILPETRQEEASDLLERLRSIVERQVFCMPHNPLTITISIGVAQLSHKNQTAFELVEEADKCLYEAKNKGKNRVILMAYPDENQTLPQSRYRSKSS